MGGWRLEVAKMAMYMTFPVALFHYFNQPEYFEDWVTRTKRDLYPPENELNRLQVEEAVQQMQERHNLKTFGDIK